MNNIKEDSIFISNLPLDCSDQELLEIKKENSQYDPYYIVSGCCSDRKEKFDRLWKKYKPYADNHFLNEIKIHFHQRSWEMYIGNVLLEKGLELESGNEGPDFIIPNIAYIECVAPTKGDPTKNDSVPEMYIAEKLDKIVVQNVPVDKMILRISQSIKEKVNHYKKWKGKKWFNENTPFIIAINTADLGHVDNSCMPNVLKTLFGFQYMQINIKNRSTSYSYRDDVKKESNKVVPVNYFSNPDFNFVSGVLFSNKNVLNHPKKIGDDCIFVNNPFAKNIIDQSFVGFFNNWFASKNKNGIKLEKCY